MPTYTYRCLHCSALQTLSQGLQELVSPACPTCGGLTQRVIAQAPPVLKNKAQAPSSLVSDAAVSQEDASVASPEHECHTACVFHQAKRRDKQRS